MHAAQTLSGTSETELVQRSLGELDFTVKADAMLGHCIRIDRKQGVVSLSPELTTTEYLCSVIVALMRIMTGKSITDRDPFRDLPQI